MYRIIKIIKVFSLQILRRGDSDFLVATVFGKRVFTAFNNYLVWLIGHLHGITESFFKK